MTKNEMMDKVIRRYGFENKKVIAFCGYAETHTEEETRKKFEKIMK